MNDVNITFYYDCKLSDGNVSLPVKLPAGVNFDNFLRLVCRDGLFLKINGIKMVKL